MSRVLIACFAVFLVGCEPYVHPYRENRCMQADLFQQCMKSLPAGPVSTHYNDWDEVVEQCRISAGAMAWRHISEIPKGC